MTNCDLSKIECLVTVFCSLHKTDFIVSVLDLKIRTSLSPHGQVSVYKRGFGGRLTFKKTKCDQQKQNPLGIANHFIFVYLSCHTAPNLSFLTFDCTESISLNQEGLCKSHNHASCHSCLSTGIKSLSTSFLVVCLETANSSVNQLQGFETCTILTCFFFFFQCKEKRDTGPDTLL